MYLVTTELMITPHQALETHLLRIQIDSSAIQMPEDFFDKRLLFASLLHDEVSATFLRNLDEGVAGHILNT
jgi:hypothetical protein